MNQNDADEIEELRKKVLQISKDVRAGKEVKSYSLKAAYLLICYSYIKLLDKVPNAMEGDRK